MKKRFHLSSFKTLFQLMEIKAQLKSVRKPEQMSHTLPHDLPCNPWLDANAMFLSPLARSLTAVGTPGWREP